MPTYREQVAEKLAPLLGPIPGANPAGADVSYDSDFEAMKAEIDKLSSVDNSEPSWSRIQQLGTGLLEKKGKDLRAASWMAVAMVKTGSWVGFADALVLYDGLLKTYWDTMYPEVRRARARVNAFAWMADMIQQHLLPRDVTLAEVDAVRTCDEALKDVDQMLADKLGDAYTGPGMLRSLMRDKVRAIPEPVAAPVAPPPPVPGAVAPPAPVAAAPPPAAAPVGATSASDVPNAMAALERVIMEGAALLRAADPKNPWGYKLQRWGAWLTVEGPPPITDGRTFLPPPDDYIRTELDGLRDAGSWLDLLNSAEQRIGEYVFWLDLHRYVATALDRLGADYAAAREMVGREVTHLVASMPTLLSTPFSDKTPIADAATQTWLQEEGAKYGGGGGSAASSAASAEDEEMAARFADAQKMVLDGKVADGLGVALALANRGADARTRFRTRLTVGKMALDGAKPELARGMLEYLNGDIERHGLETWEPALCATFYAHLLVATREVSRAKGGSPDLEAREQFLFDKLCRLDPASAIRLST